MRYFYEDDGEQNGKRIDCAFENMYVHGRGCTYYALVGPTAPTGSAIVCADMVLFPADPDSHGVEDVFILTRTCVLEMKRGPNYQFIYAQMMSIDDTDSEGVVETYT